METDICFLQMLGLIGMMDFPMACQEFWPRSGQRYPYRRLAQMRDENLILQAQIPQPVRITRDGNSGRLPSLYRLFPKGADLVESVTGKRPLRTSRTELPSTKTLLHRLGIARSLLAILRAAQRAKLPAPKIHIEYDPVLPPPESKNATFAERFLLCNDLTLPGGVIVKCWPDCAVLLSIENRKLQLLFEYDRSTMTLEAIKDKMPGYEALLSQRKLWPWSEADDCRVMFIVPSSERMQNIARAVAKSPAAKYVRLIVVNHVTAEQVLANPVWFTTDGNKLRILPEPTLSAHRRGAP